MKLYTFTPKKNAAQAMVEFAIVLPILLLLLYGLLEAGRLLFIYSTIVTASRQAVRYGSATGEGSTPGFPRYQDCAGIRLAAQKVDFLNAFDDVDIIIYHDEGPGTTLTPYCGGDPVTNPPPVTDDTFAPEENYERVVITIDGDFLPIIPKLVPFIERSVSNNNPISAMSARTILTGVQIEVTSPAGPEEPPPGVEGFLLGISADPNSFGSVGQQIVYTFTLTNTNEAGTPDLVGPYMITGPSFGVDCSAATSPLPAGGSSTTCTGTYTITQADLDAGAFTVNATATASDGTETITSNTATLTINLVPQPAITLSKTASRAVATTGDTVTYTFTVTNSGNVAVTSATVSDPKLGGTIAGCSGDLAVAAALTCTANYVLVASDINNDTMVNQATASATYESQTVTADASATVYTGDLFLTVTASPASVNQVGQVITYTYTIYDNTGGPLYPPYSVTGDRGTDDCSGNTTPLASHGSVTCTGTYTVTQADLDAGQALVNNNIQATACTESDQCNGNREIESNTASVSVAVVTNPSLSLQASATPLGPTPPDTAMTLGTVVNYTYTLTNTGNVTLTSTFAIADSQVSNATCSDTSNMPPGGIKTCTGTHTVSQADLDAGSFSSTASGSAAFNSQPVSASAAPITVVTYQGARLRLTITPNPTTFTGAGQFIIYTYTLTNAGSVPLIGPYTVTDSKVTFVDCAPATSPLAIGASTTCVGSYASTQPDVDKRNIVNSASVTASDGTQIITSNSAMAVVYTPGAPTITPTGPNCAGSNVTLTASADAWVNQSSPTANNGIAITLNVQSRSGSRNQRTLVQFSLPSVPAGCVIQSATLRLNASNSTNGRTLQALQVSSSWVENSVNWNNQPSTTGTAATTTSGSGWREWNVTSIVQAMYSGTNNGFLIRDASENAGGNGETQQFISSENSSSDKPQLVIVFVPGP